MYDPPVTLPEPKVINPLADLTEVHDGRCQKLMGSSASIGNSIDALLQADQVGPHEVRNGVCATPWSELLHR